MAKAPAKKSARKSKPNAGESVAPPNQGQALRLEWRTPAELAENPANWRRHPQEQLGALAGVIAEVGWAGACLYNEATKRLIDGHARRKVALERGEEKVPVLVGSWTEEQERKILASLDPLSAMAVADPVALSELLGQIDTECAELQAMLDALAEASPVAPEPGLTDPDAIPEAPKEPVTKLGDIWCLGDARTGHRLMCGDSTDPANVLLLMLDERAGLMAIDPPYGVAYANDERPNPGVAKPRVAKPRVANDVLEDEALQEFLEKAFAAAVAHALKPEAAWYMWHAHLTQGYFAAAAAANVVLHRQIIWVKPVLLLGRGQYHWKHEPCFMGWVKGQQPPDYGLGNGERTQTTVWEIGNVTQDERKELNHSTPKPVALFEIPIVKHLKAGEICFDGFTGSGPQLIAAHKTGRRFFGCELEPRFVDTCLARFAAFTGIDPIRESDGASFAKLAGERDGS